MISLYVKMLEFIRYQLPFSILQSIFGTLHYTQNYLVYYAPNYLYNIIYLFFYPFMCLITVLAENWVSAPYVAEGLSPQYEPNGIYVNGANKQQLENAKNALLAHNNTRLNNNTLFQLFDSLPALPAIDTLGYYKIDFVNSNSVLGLLKPAMTLLSYIGIDAGKRYRAVNVGDPWYWLIQHRIVLPALVCGNADLLNISFRNKMSVAMSYNQLPWIDYFRVLEESNGKRTLLGIYAIKGKFAGFFTMEQLVELEQATEHIHFTQYMDHPVKHEQNSSNGANGSPRRRKKSHK